MPTLAAELAAEVLGALPLEAEAQPDEAPNCVAIHLVSAKGLPVMDKNLLSKGGSSDPFARFQVVGGDSDGKEFESEVKYKTLQPVWRELFQLPLAL